MFSYFIENLSLKRESKLDNFLNKKIVPSFFVKNIQFFRAISCGCPVYFVNHHEPEFDGDSQSHDLFYPH